jgi:pimeloyl-ACP methyl ester carboxylesterase
MWWWLIPLAPGVPERLVVGNERCFLTWFYEGATAKPEAIEPATVDEYLRTFSGREGVLGAMGVYRAAFTSIEQTTPLTKQKITVPTIAMGGAKGLGAKVGEMVKLVAKNVTAQTLSDSGHFMPEECPEEIIKQVLSFTAKAKNLTHQ